MSFIDFDLGNRFCYFLDLLESAKTDSSFDRAKRKLFWSANEYMVIPIYKALNFNQTNPTKEITIAIDFIKQAAMSERNKEIAVINKYIDEIKKDPMIIKILQKPSKQRDDLTHLLNDLRAFSQSSSPSTKDIQNFYIKLTLLLNTINRNIQAFQARITQLNSSVRRTQQAIRADFMPLRLKSDIESLFKSMTGIIQRKTKDMATISRIKELLINYATTHLNNNEEFLLHPYEVLAALLINFEYFLQEKLNKEIAADSKTFKTLDDLPIEELFDEWIEQSNVLIQQLETHDKNLENLYEAIREQTGLRIVGKRSEEYQANLNKLRKNNQNNNRATARSAINRKLSKVIGADILGPQNAWSLNGNTTHGSIYELIGPALISAFATKVRGHAATDVIQLKIGEITLKSLGNDANLITEKGHEIAKIIGDYAAEQRKNALTDMTVIVNQMNEDIRDVTDEINTLLKEHAIHEDIFIYHESLKLYSTVEMHETGKFHGREMEILNALDLIYSMNNIADLELMNKDIMYNIALNLADLAIGGEVRGEVENYLSIFAGMLLFDDLQNMALDIGKNAVNDLSNASGEAKHIHLYLVNDIYIPGSMLLTILSKALEQGYTHITAKNGASVEINTSEANESIKKYLTQRENGTLEYSPELWPQYRESARQGTKIRITFLASFFSFLKDIQKYIN